MKRNTTILIFILSLCNFAQAQNLVLNPSFEQHTQCPTQYSEISYCNNWADGAMNSTCDYFSALNCSTNYSPPLIIYSSLGSFYQEPLNGKSFAGIIPYESGGVLREFLQGILISPLINNKVYYAEFYVNATGQQKYFIHNFSALFTDTNGLVDENNLAFYNPQINSSGITIYKDTVNWMRINGYFTASGSEQFITIGNFTPHGQELKDSVTSPYLYSFYFIDSVGVYEVTHLDNWNAGPDKHINYGDSVQIGNPNTDLSMFSWVNSVNDFTFLSDSTKANPWSKPWQTTTYYVTKTQGTNIFKDTVTVFVTGGTGIKGLEENNTQVTVCPNPSNGVISIKYNLKENAQLEISDLNGRLVGTYFLPAYNNQVEVKNEYLKNGVYMYRASTNGHVIKIGKIIVIE